MSKYNAASTGSKTTNLAGGEAFKQSPELELVSILLTSFASDQFYRTESQTYDQLVGLLKRVDPKFAAQAAVYARTQFGVRSISHAAASELAKHVSGKEWATAFYNAIVHRPDDILEILAYHMAKNGKPSNAMKRGLALSFDKFDRYALAKYRGEGKSVKMVDAVNILHPKPTDKNAEAIKALVEGNLRSFDTWESELTKAGQVAKSADEKLDLKRDAWAKLISERKIGYFALLRNLRNIIEQAPESLDAALELLVDEKLIKKSLVLPFRVNTAYEEIQAMNTPAASKVLTAIAKAVDISLSNVPVFLGRTLVVLDVSGSMTVGYGRNGNIVPAKIGALFAAVLAKANDADLMTFDNSARYVNVNKADSAMTIARSIRFPGGGTDFHTIFRAAREKYDRVIILSDMQGWIGYDSPTAEFADYKKRTGANPHVYSFDLQGYGTMQFPERNVCALAGFSDKVFDVMAMVEQDPKALITKIKEVTF
jgi:hypothetical protein